MTSAEVRDAIERGWARLTAAIDMLGEGVSTAVVTEEGWTAKDVLAHMIHWATQAAFGLGAQVKPPEYMLAERKRREAAGVDTTGMPTGDESNALAVANYANKSFEDVSAELTGMVDAIIERIQPLSDEQMNATDRVPFASGRPLWQFIGGETFFHWPVHAEAIERAAATAAD